MVLEPTGYCLINPVFDEHAWWIQRRKRCPWNRDAWDENVICENFTRIEDEDMPEPRKRLTLLRLLILEWQNTEKQTTNLGVLSDRKSKLVYESLGCVAFGSHQLWIKRSPQWLQWCPRLEMWAMCSLCARLLLPRSPWLLQEGWLLATFIPCIDSPPNWVSKIGS